MLVAVIAGAVLVWSVLVGRFAYRAGFRNGHHRGVSDSGRLLQPFEGVVRSE